MFLRKVVGKFTVGRELELHEVGCDEVMSKTQFMESFEDLLRKYLHESKAGE